MTGRSSSTRVRPFVAARQRHRPTSRARRLGDRAARSRTWNRQQQAGEFVRPVRPGACVEGASGPWLPESRKCLSKPECRLELAGYMNVSPQVFLKPESAYFSIGFGNVKLLPNSELVNCSGGFTPPFAGGIKPPLRQIDLLPEGKGYARGAQSLVGSFRIRPQCHPEPPTPSARPRLPSPSCSAPHARLHPFQAGYPQSRSETQSCPPRGRG